MKVIDLLNRIANEEEVSTFRYLDRTLRYNKEEKCFDDINDISYCRTGFGCNGLNDEVEIIEEDKGIEEDKKIENNFQHVYNSDNDMINANFENIRTTLKNIINVINEMREDK